jgi:hypothetical protein
MSLSEFLLARIAEDEQAAAYATTRAKVGEHAPGGWGGWWIGHYHHYIRHDPARVLAECDAERRIVAWCSERERIDVSALQDDVARESHFVLGGLIHKADSVVLRYLALPYADHPDFREEWRV